MVNTQHTHICTPAGSALLYRFGSGVKNLHKAYGAGGNAAC